jgi:hypothetical protein
MLYMFPRESWWLRATRENNEICMYVKTANTLMLVSHRSKKLFP